MTMRIKVVKESKFLPVVGEVRDVQPSPGVRVLLRKGYIVTVDDAPVPYAPIPEETEVTDTTEQARAAADLEDDAPGEQEPAEAILVDGTPAFVDDDGLPVLSADGELELDLDEDDDEDDD